MYRWLSVGVFCLVLVACGGGSAGEQETGAAGSGDESGEPAAGESRAAADESGSRRREERPTSQQESVPADATVLTEVPDPCEFLTRSDAEELLEQATDAGRSLDAGGWNCVYDTSEPSRRLVLNMHVGRDLSVENTQIGITVRTCQSEVAQRFDDLGLDSALYRNPDDACGGGGFLWVVAPARFQGRLPYGEREISGPIHFTVSVSSRDGGEDVPLPVLRAAAERVLEALSG